MSGRECKPGAKRKRDSAQPQDRAQPKNELTREPQFLLAAVRRFLGSDAALPDAAGLDWPVLLQLSDAHAVTPMPYAMFIDGIQFRDSTNCRLPAPLSKYK